MDQQNQLESSISNIGIQTLQDQYMPSSVEKKKALMMYFLFGIIIVISNKKVNDFEFFHVKQAMWWWMIFILSILISVVILFVPVIKFLWIIWLLVVMGVFVVFVKQAWDGKYHQDVTKYNLGLFPSLWSWLFWLFGISFDWSDLANWGINTTNQTVSQTSQDISNADQSWNVDQTMVEDQTQNLDQNKNNS